VPALLLIGNKPFGIPCFALGCAFGALLVSALARTWAYGFLRPHLPH
jgi:hypothetical protein